MHNGDVNEFLKMDIFFVVSTIAVVLLTALVGIAVMKLLRILDHVEKIAKIAGDEAEHIRGDAAYIRGRLLGIFDSLLAFIPGRLSRKDAKDKRETSRDVHS